MSTFEIQLYKSGIWNVDSYFDDREIALSEAERLNNSGRHAGVRVLQEDFDESSNSSRCRVVFSKMLKSEQSEEWRVHAKRASVSRQGEASEPKTRPARKRVMPDNRRPSLWFRLIVCLIVVVVGLVALIGLQEFQKYL